MQVVITLRKEVETREQGLEIFELVKAKFVEQPDIKVTGHVSNHFVDSES